jgi:hypothetical protein
MEPMPHVEVRRSGSSSFRVTVEEGKGRTEHEVLAGPGAVRRHGGAVPPEELLQASVAFLLEREPKESILPRFELSEIERHFPDHPAKIRRRVARWTDPPGTVFPEHVHAEDEIDAVRAARSAR